MRDAILKLESIRDDQREKYRHYLKGRVHMGKSEIKGSKSVMSMKPTVWEVIGVNHAGRPVKKIIKPKRSFHDANVIGSRGVYYVYNLRHGGAYKIQTPISRRRKRRYYAYAVDGAIHELSEKEIVCYVESSKISS